MASPREIYHCYLREALNNILGEEKAQALIGEDGSGLTQAMEFAAVSCFRRQRQEDSHTRLLRDALTRADRGEL